MSFIEPVIKPFGEISEKSWGYSLLVTHRNGGLYKIYSDSLYKVRAVKNGENFSLEKQEYGGSGFVQFDTSPRMASADKGLIRRIRREAKKILKNAVGKTMEIDVGLPEQFLNN